MDPVNPLVTGRVRCTTAARILKVSPTYIAQLKGNGHISNTGHGYCVFEEVDKYLKELEAKRKAGAGKYEPPMRYVAKKAEGDTTDEVHLEKTKRRKGRLVGLDQVGIRARRVTHPNPIFDNGDRY